MPEAATAMNWIQSWCGLPKSKPLAPPEELIATSANTPVKERAREAADAVAGPDVERIVDRHLGRAKVHCEIRHDTRDDADRDRSDRTDEA